MQGGYTAMLDVSEREALVRFCARYTGDPTGAEDLAQKTLLAAWQHEQQLRDPQARQAWLFSIARRECLAWARSRDRSRLVNLDSLDEWEGRSAGDFDIETELERDDLARLLDRAMGLLPPDLREVLVRRYIEESSQGELAERLGISEGAVEARLHRGKLALRRVLSTKLSEDALAFGLISASDAGWEETRLWCPGCGRRRLEGRFRRDEGWLYMRCPDCSRSGDDFSHFIHSTLSNKLRAFQSYKPALSRVLEGIHQMYRVQARRGVTRCPGCGEWQAIGQGTPPWVPERFADPQSVYLHHPRCGIYDWESWHALTWSLPEVRRFWRENPRMRFLPAREVDFQGSPAMVTGFESVTSSARLEVVSLRDTLEVVSIEGAVGLRADG